MSNDQKQPALNIQQQPYGQNYNVPQPGYVPSESGMSSDQNYPVYPQQYSNPLQNDQEKVQFTQPGQNNLYQGTGYGAIPKKDDGCERGFLYGILCCCCLDCVF
jgi:hypothetical protein